MDVDSALDGESVAGPGTEIAEAGKSRDVISFDGNEHGIGLFKARTPPGNAVVAGGRAIIVDGSRMDEHVIVNGGDLIEVGQDGISNLHDFLVVDAVSDLQQE
jgi:hypothetical protein